MSAVCQDRSPRRTLTEAQKKTVAARQNFKCANKPGNNPLTYDCPFWVRGGDGSFDESGYEIDHIVEWCVSRDDSEQNLQALCVCCHRVKTRRAAMKRRREKRNDNVILMDVVF
tara:strand:- start:2549 stop:2890 length:342 start_codon:yes stop_codon:yes gene_type:complete